MSVSVQFSSIQSLQASLPLTHGGAHDLGKNISVQGERKKLQLPCYKIANKSAYNFSDGCTQFLPPPKKKPLLRFDFNNRNKTMYLL